MIRRRKETRRSFGSSSLKKYSNTGKEYSNPFFKNKKRKSGKRKNLPIFSLKYKLIVFGVLLIIFIIVWFFLYSSYFVIKNIEARGGGRLDPIKIQDIAWKQIWDSDFLLWQQKNIFIFDDEELIETLNLKYSFNDIIVNKKLPDKIIIEFNEKEHSVMWYEKGVYHYADAKGYIVERIGDSPEEKDYPIIENNSNVYIQDNRVGVRQELIDSVLVILERNKEDKQLAIARFVVDENNNTLKLRLVNGPDLLFDVSKDVDKQLNKIYTLKNDILKDDFYKKEYIDVRIGDRVYHR